MGRGVRSVAVLVHPSDQPLLTSVSIGYGGLGQKQREAVGPVGGGLLRTISRLGQKLQSESEWRTLRSEGSQHTEWESLLSESCR